MQNHWKDIFQKLTHGHNSMRTNIVFYNRDTYNELRLLAFRQRTNISSIISNVGDKILKDMANPIETMDPFMHGAPPPQIWDEKEKWLKYMKLLSVEEFKEFDKQLNMLLNLLDKAKLDGKY